jgi:hypothetical protein
MDFTDFMYQLIAMEGAGLLAFVPDRYMTW